MTKMDFKYKVLTYTRTPSKQNKYVLYHFYRTDEKLLASLEDKFYDSNTVKVEVIKQDQGVMKPLFTIKPTLFILFLVNGLKAIKEPENMKESVEALESLKKALLSIKQDHDVSAIEADIEKVKELISKQTETE